tara:strand:- start:997 stop:1611 length:615 start_codon:yes stop_codon:yes gene_type:complete
MKYIVNETNSCGQASISDEARNNLLVSMGFAPNQEMIKENQIPVDTIAAQSADAAEDTELPTLYEWDGSVFALDDEVFEIEGDLFLKAVELDGETKSHLDESHAELFINEVKFDETGFSLGDIYDYGTEIYIKLDEGKKKGDKSADKEDDDDKGDFETGARKGDESDVKKDDDDKGDFETGARKGDDSKTHKGKDFLKNLKKKS